MRNCILISNKKDPDLVALYHRVGGQEFANLTKDALRSIVRGGYKGKTQKPQNILLQSNNEYADIRFVLTITSEKDEDVRNLLSHVAERKLGQFVKQALRFYLGPAIILSGYLNSEFSQKIEENSTQVQVFAFGEVQSGNLKSKTKVTKKTKTARKPIKDKFSYDNKEVYSTTSNSFENTISAATSNITEQTFIENVPTYNQFDTGNDEDDVLAMLEGLLM